MKLPLDQVTKTGVQERKPNALHELALAVSRRGYVRGKMVLSLKGNSKQRNTSETIPVEKITILREFACKTFWNN